MLIKASINSWDEKLRSPSPELLEAVKQLFPEAYVSSERIYGLDGVVELNTVMEFMEKTGIEATIKPIKGLRFYHPDAEFRHRLETLEHSLHLLKDRGNVFGDIIQVHTPNAALTTFNEIEIFENCCTNEIKDALKEGWRIICVCPPLNERRPTYIMGRYVDTSNRTLSSVRER